MKAKEFTKLDAHDYELFAGASVAATKVELLNGRLLVIADQCRMEFHYNDALHNAYQGYIVFATLEHAHLAQVAMVAYEALLMDGGRVLNVDEQLITVLETLGLALEEV